MPNLGRGVFKTFKTSITTLDSLCADKPNIPGRLEKQPDTFQTLRKRKKTCLLRNFITFKYSFLTEIPTSDLGLTTKISTNTYNELRFINCLPTFSFDN